tara:strand:- start:319 stop:690 length:372 start_codon:yes stop_codon:yes gene_type:complete
MARSPEPASAAEFAEDTLAPNTTVDHVPLVVLLLVRKINWDMPDDTETIVAVPVVSVTVKVFVPVFLTKIDSPTDTCVAAGNCNWSPVAEAVISNMLLTGVLEVRFPLIGHTRAVLTLIVSEE